MKTFSIRFVLFCAIALFVGAGFCRAANDSIEPAIFPRPILCELSADYVPLVKIAIASADADAINWAEMRKQTHHRGRFLCGNPRTQ